MFQLETESVSLLSEATVESVAAARAGVASDFARHTTVEEHELKHQVPLLDAPVNTDTSTNSGSNSVDNSFLQS